MYCELATLIVNSSRVLSLTTPLSLGANSLLSKVNQMFWSCLIQSFEMSSVSGPKLLLRYGLDCDLASENDGGIEEGNFSYLADLALARI